jgi:hypothetical protein
MSFAKLRGRIKAARNYGVVHAEVRDRAAIGAVGVAETAAADALTRSLGFRVLGDAWVSLDPPRARRVAQEILWRDLAYRHEIMDPAAAEALADAFLTHFDAGARFFTNFTCLDETFQVGRNSTSCAVTEATCDCGIVVVDSRSAGILWAEDQD